MLSPKSSLSPKRKASSLTPVGVGIGIDVDINMNNNKSPKEVNHIFPAVNKNTNTNVNISPTYANTNIFNQLLSNDATIKHFKTNMYSSDGIPFSNINMNNLLNSLQNNTNCEIIYLQQAIYLTDEYLKRLGDILIQKHTSIWCLYIDNAKYISNKSWKLFIQQLYDSKITHCYLSTTSYMGVDENSSLTSELIHRCKETIRLNRKKHDYYSNRESISLIKEKCTHLWWSPYKNVLYEQLRNIKANENALLYINNSNNNGNVNVTPGSRRTRGSSSVASPNLKEWIFECIPCGETSNSSLPIDQHPSGHLFECSICKIWSHVGCVLPASCIPPVTNTTQAVAALLPSNRHTNTMDTHAYDASNVKYSKDDLYELDVSMLCSKCYATSNNNTRNDTSLCIQLPQSIDTLYGKQTEPLPSVTTQQRSAALASSFSEVLSLKSPLYLSNGVGHGISGSVLQYSNSNSNSNSNACSDRDTDKSGNSGNDTDNTDGIDHHATDIHPIRKKTRTESEIMEELESVPPIPSATPTYSLSPSDLINTNIKKKDEESFNLNNLALMSNNTTVQSVSSNSYSNSDNFSNNSATISTSSSSNHSTPISVNSEENSTISGLTNTTNATNTSDAHSQLPSQSQSQVHYHSTDVTNSISTPPVPTSLSNGGSTPTKTKPSIPLPIKVEKVKKDISLDECGNPNPNPTNGNNSNAQNASMMVRMRKRNNRGAAFTINTPVMVPALGCGGVITEEKNGGWKYVTFYKPVTTDASIIGKTVAAAALKLQNTGGGPVPSQGPPVDASGQPLPPPPGSIPNSNPNSNLGESGEETMPPLNEITHISNTNNNTSANTNTSANGNPQVVIVGKWCRACDICEIGDDGVATGNTSKSYFSVKGHSGITGNSNNTNTGQKLSLIHRYKHSNNTNPSKKKEKEKLSKNKPVKSKSLKQLKFEQKLYSMNDGICCSIDDNEVVDIENDVDIDMLHCIVSNGTSYIHDNEYNYPVDIDRGLGYNINYHDSSPQSNQPQSNDDDLSIFDTDADDTDHEFGYQLQNESNGLGQKDMTIKLKQNIKRDSMDSNPQPPSNLNYNNHNINRVRSATYANGTGYGCSLEHLTSLYGSGHHPIDGGVGLGLGLDLGSGGSGGSGSGGDMKTGKRRRSSIDILTDVDGEIFDAEFRNSVALQLLGSQLNIHTPYSSMENIRKSPKRSSQHNSKITNVRSTNVMKASSKTKAASSGENVIANTAIISTNNSSISNSSNQSSGIIDGNSNGNNFANVHIQKPNNGGGSGLRTHSHSLNDLHQIPVSLSIPAVSMTTDANCNTSKCNVTKTINIPSMDSITNTHTNTEDTDSYHIPHPHSPSTTPHTSEMFPHMKSGANTSTSPSVPPMLFETGHDESDMEQFLRDLETGSPLLHVG